MYHFVATGSGKGVWRGSICLLHFDVDGIVVSEFRCHVMLLSFCRERNKQNQRRELHVALSS
jgi:uncharacterized protein (UPF0254 family)